MNFQQLDYVLAVHEQRHFGRAAESCHVTQATLSAMIKKLEEELSITIFDRSHQPVQTTDKGMELIKLARKILGHRNELIALGKASPTALEGSLHLGVIPTVANSLLPIILPRILDENPGLQLTVSEITTEEIAQQLKQDKIDIGLLATPLEDQQLEETILYYEPMMLYGVSDSQKKYVSGKDVRNRKIWLLEEGNCFRSQSMSICNIKEKELAESNLQFEGSSFDTLLNLTDRFGGYTLVPELYYHSLPKKKRRLTKPFETPIPVREISLVQYRPYAKKQTVEFLARLIKEEIKGHLSSEEYSAKELAIIGI